MRLKLLTIFLSLSLSTSISCVRYVYLPEESEYYRQGWLKAQEENENLKDRLELCTGALMALRMNCD